MSNAAGLSFSFLKMALVKLLIFISIFHLCRFDFKLAFDAPTGEAGGVKHPFLPKGIGTSRALLDHSCLWYGSCGVEIQEIITRVCVDCPDPCVKSVTMSTQNLIRTTKGKLDKRRLVLTTHRDPQLPSCFCK